MKQGSPEWIAARLRRGRALQAVREAAGMTRREFAAAVGESYRSIYGMESGMDAPSVRRLSIILIAFNHSRRCLS
jgi:transcriptional regulator with XRE-family HTH domain